MKRVVGLGGVFFKSREPGALRSWYRDRLGIDAQEYGTMFRWREAEAPERIGYTVWNPFSADTQYFAPSEQPFMINYRVADMEKLIAALEAEGVTIAGGIEQHENGKFAWILDPEGNKIELWEPVDADKDPYL